MSSTSSSRQAILDRIRTATKKTAGERVEYANLERNYVQTGSLSAADRLHLMIERLREYDAEVVECSPEELTATIARQVAASGRHVLVAPEGLPPEWLQGGAEWKIDHNLSTDDIEHTDGVLTASSAGVADSGTIVLHHTATEGRRIVTLLPDWHLCVLRASQVVETLPEYFARFDKAPNLATYISGPSATADIEMTRIKGVHGPRFLVVVLVRDDSTPGAAPAAP